MPELEDRTGEARAVGNLGLLCLKLGRLDEARPYLELALSLMRETGDRLGEAHVISDLGRYHEATAHDGLGHCRLALDDRERARRHWRLALDLFTQLDAPEAAEVRSRLQSLR